MTAPTWHDEDEAPSLLDRLPSWAPRWLTDRPYSLAQTLRYVQEGEFTAEDSGSPRRWGHWAWIVVVLLPVWSMANLAIWATERPGRGIPIALGGTIVATGLNSLPAFAGVVPDWWTLPYWWATVTGWWAA